MKTIGKILMLLAVASITLFSSCRKKKVEEPDDDKKVYVPTYKDGVTDGEEFEIEDKVVDGSVQVEGGELTVSGNAVLTGDINMEDDEDSEVIIKDDAVVHHINMHAGTLYLSGSPTIETDFNLVDGKSIIGNDLSTMEDTVTIRQINTDDTLIIYKGVVVVEKDLNQNKGFINVTDSAKLIVEGTFNKAGDVYGVRNIDADVFNKNHGITEDEPWEVYNAVEDRSVSAPAE